MKTKALRLFYRLSDSQIVWTHLIFYDNSIPQAPFVTTIHEDLAQIPFNMPDGETPLGGTSNDYLCISLDDIGYIDAFLASDTNQIINEQLYIGEPRPEPEPNLDRERAAELLSTSPTVITMPEIWELMRIFGRFHGIPNI